MELKSVCNTLQLIMLRKNNMKGILKSTINGWVINYKESDNEGIQEIILDPNEEKQFNTSEFIFDGEEVEFVIADYGYVGKYAKSIKHIDKSEYPIHSAVDMLHSRILFNLGLDDNDIIELRRLVRECKNLEKEQHSKTWNAALEKKKGLFGNKPINDDFNNYFAKIYI